MFNILIFIIFSVFTSYAFACVVPHHGEDINKLIEVKLIEDEVRSEYGFEKYLITFPKHIGDYEFGFIDVFIFDPSNRKDSINIPVQAIESNGSMGSNIEG